MARYHCFMNGAVARAPATTPPSTADPSTAGPSTAGSSPNNPFTPLVQGGSQPDIEHRSPTLIEHLIEEATTNPSPITDALRARADAKWGLTPERKEEIYGDRTYKTRDLYVNRDLIAEDLQRGEELKWHLLGIELMMAIEWEDDV